MTLRAGQVRVSATRQQLLAVAVWIERQAREPAGLLTGADWKSRADAEARSVAAGLRLAARHERRFVTLDRETACYCARLNVGLHVPFAASHFANECRKAVGTRRGAPGLTLAQLRQRLQDATGDERELRRLRKRERLEGWLERLRARGETLLTATEKPPS